VTGQPAVLSVAPHPDDELLGAPVLLMALRDSGWRVVNLACSLGRPPDRQRRRLELEEACRRARFELMIPDRTPPIGADDDLAAAQERLAELVAQVAATNNTRVIVGPSPEDGHHAHELVGRAIQDAVQSWGRRVRVVEWGVWADLRRPNLIVWYGRRRLNEILHALAAHEGELRRARFDRMLEARGIVNAVLGPERVLGYGVVGREVVGADADGDDAYAELLTEQLFSPDTGWKLCGPRSLYEREVAPQFARSFGSR
jgi:LmbE family N-acetylglucosaminyl deacetylase